MKIVKSKYCSGKGLAAAKLTRMGVRFAAYGGHAWRVGDRNMPSDNTYQTIIPGTDIILDAGAPQFPPFGLGHMINECWRDDLANCRAINHGNIMYLVISILPFN